MCRGVKNNQSATPLVADAAHRRQLAQRSQNTNKRDVVLAALLFHVQARLDQRLELQLSEVLLQRDVEVLVDIQRLYDLLHQLAQDGVDGAQGEAPPQVAAGGLILVVNEAALGGVELRSISRLRPGDAGKLPVALPVQGQLGATTACASSEISSHRTL